MDILNDALNVFKQSESEAAAEMRKIKAAKTIITSLKKLKKRIDKIRTQYQCNEAVNLAQRIIDGA